MGLFFLGLLSISHRSNNSLQITNNQVNAESWNGVNARSITHGSTQKGIHSDIKGNEVGDNDFLRKQDLHVNAESTQKGNPANDNDFLRQHRDLTTGYVHYGFGYDSDGDDYKVVRMEQLVKEGGGGGVFGCEHEAKVYSLKNDKWKNMEGLPTRLFDIRGKWLKITMF
ncbi:hypothetical protein OIU84_011802 [Salix udensis]|uniref:Uncharacterized protein n=1 Tax=Salix udensis TaxID=889485 RepID=A0AAD6JQ69_9ROSI|nr:hypothetical protein OIU84_011802 [Salix udensis]